VRVLQVSAVHVYLTYPFVLSWSLLEAMACGCLVIGSDTAPVRELVRNQEDGILVNFVDGDAIAKSVIETLLQPGRMYAQRQAGYRAAQTRFSSTKALGAIEILLLGSRSADLRSALGRCSESIPDIDLPSQDVA
jgi:hypothetical protein